MVVDARDPNQAHKRAPHTRLGTPATIGALDLSPQALAAVGADTVDAHAATIDLRDSFYQFRCRRLASWFGCEWPETAEVWGTTTVWNPDTELDEDVDPSEP
eukprot:1865068-Heterocapsa_arctica.AAC.1